MLKKLQKQFNVVEKDGGNSYLLYEKEDIGIYSASPFIIEIFNDLNGYFHVKGYESTNSYETVINNINEYISKLDYPSEFYNPLFKDGYGLELMVDYDMRKLGFQRSESGSGIDSDSIYYEYVHKSIYGQEKKIVIRLGNLSSFADLNKNISITYILDNFNWVKCGEVTRDAQLIIEKIKTILYPLFITDIVQLYTQSDKFKPKDSNQYDIILATLNKKGQYVEKEFKDELKEKLKTLLKSL